jgi:hypothetical protein
MQPPLKARADRANSNGSRATQGSSVRIKARRLPSAATAPVVPRLVATDDVGGLAINFRTFCPEIECSSATGSFQWPQWNYAGPKTISTEGRGAVGTLWAISSSSASTRRMPVASVIFRLSARGDRILWGAASLEDAKINAPTLPPAHTKLSSSQLAAMANPIE